MATTIWARALEALEDRGWNQGSAGWGEGCLCVGGAIAYAYCGDPMEMYNGYLDLNDLLTQFADHVGAEKISARYQFPLFPSERVYQWNDAGRFENPGPQRTFEEVKKVLLELDELERNGSDA